MHVEMILQEIILKKVVKFLTISLKKLDLDLNKFIIMTTAYPLLMRVMYTYFRYK